MRAIYIYNKHSEKELTQAQRAIDEMSYLIQTIDVYDLQDVRHIYPIRATPALILIRDDFQGEELLDEVDGQLRIVGELAKALEEEDRNIYQSETHRIDHLINVEKAAAQDELLMDLLDREVL